MSTIAATRAAPCRRPARLLLAGALAALASAGCGGHFEEPTLAEHWTPGAHNDPPQPRQTAWRDERQLYFGDLHIHTAYSYDAYSMGARALPEDAYRFAQGGAIAHGLGYPIRLSRPLDFAAVTDHAEFLGVPKHANEAAIAEGATDRVARFRQALADGNRWAATWHTMYISLFELGSRERRLERFGQPGSEAISRQAWQHIIRAAEESNRPGAFTSFIGYEWSSMPADENLHRNVIYRSARVPEYPFSSLDSEDPRALWRALDAQRAQGMDALAIPHNGNLSNGRMYAGAQFDGQPFDARYAAARARNEPISEIMQIKGQSETHPTLSGEDEFADFEVLDTMLKAKVEASEPKGSYARDALRRGLSLWRREGFNPFRFGVIGASDSHNASTPAEEGDYHGKLAISDGAVSMRMGSAMVLFGHSMSQRLRNWGSAGLAAVWAEENTRQALFAALRRGETYATSGPRISLRFFGGWDLAEDALDRPDGVALAYRHGVPMGGELVQADDGADAPRFAVWTIKDPLGANLDRAQIVKLWTDASGASHERVYDVGVGDGRRAGSDGRFATVGSTVNVAEASYRNAIGSSAISAHWRDPDFDPDQPAAYYARVLEIPTPRWTAYDAKRLDMPAPEPSTIQERAVSSSIWYLPRR